MPQITPTGSTITSTLDKGPSLPFASQRYGKGLNIYGTFPAYRRRGDG